MTGGSELAKSYREAAAGCTKPRERLNKGWLKKFRERVKGGKVHGKNKIGGKGSLGGK